MVFCATACGAQGDQVVCKIPCFLALPDLMMYFEACRLAASMAAPATLQFTVISSLSEVPPGSDRVLDSTETTPEEAAQEIVLCQEREGYIGVYTEPA